MLLPNMVVKCGSFWLKEKTLNNIERALFVEPVDREPITFESILKNMNQHK